MRTTLLWLAYGIVSAGMIVSFFGEIYFRRRAEDAESIKQLHFLNGSSIAYAKDTASAKMCRKIARRFDIAYYMLAGANITIAWFLRLFPWQ